MVYELTAAERRAALDELDAILAAGWLQTRIAARFPLEQVVAAHEAVEQGADGNVVIEMP